MLNIACYSAMNALTSFLFRNKIREGLLGYDVSQVLFFKAEA